MLEEFEDVLSIKPGKTDLIEHHIAISTTKPIKLPPYRVPQAYQVMVRQEMLNQGIIEPSVSKWASPIVPILKKDGFLRLCVDYRCIIVILQTNAYPMPRIDVLLDQLGQAHFCQLLISLENTGKYQWPKLVVKVLLLISFASFNLQSCHLGLVEHHPHFSK